MSKWIYISLGICCIIVAVFLAFAIVVYSLKESDEDMIYYLAFPAVVLGIGVFLIMRGKRNMLL